jgi:hypothetical protein
MMALAALSCGLAHHRMLTLTLAALLCQLDSPDTFLKASYARPGQERDEGQDGNTGYPEAMSCVSLHDTLQILLSSPRVPVNPYCLLPRHREPGSSASTVSLDAFSILRFLPSAPWLSSWYVLRVGSAGS